jgi:hypothetical protein
MMVIGSPGCPQEDRSVQLPEGFWKKKVQGVQVRNPGWKTSHWEKRKLSPALRSGFKQHYRPQTQFGI